MRFFNFKRLRKLFSRKKRPAPKHSVPVKATNPYITLGKTNINLSRESINFSIGDESQTPPLYMHEALKQQPKTTSQQKATPRKSKHPEYFRKSYEKLWKQSNNRIVFDDYKLDVAKETVVALFKDYKKGSIFGRFFSGHWRRHHVAKADALIKNINKEDKPRGLQRLLQAELTTLLSNEKNNKNGAYARRLRFSIAKLEQTFSLTKENVMMDPRANRRVDHVNTTLQATARAR